MKTALNLTVFCLAASFAHAQVLTNTWTYEGGGLDPETYGGNFRPATLVSDIGSTGTASIAMSGLTSGGLGSSGAGAYGGIYSFFSAGLTLSLQASNVLEGLDQVTFGFLAGTVIYSQESITLNYNPENSAVASSGFSTVPGIIVESPIGDQTLTAYLWTWSDLSLLGNSSAFSIDWNAVGTTHTFITDIALTQAVPEPSVFALLALGISATIFWHRRTRGAGSLHLKLPS